MNTDRRQPRFAIRHTGPLRLVLALLLALAPLLSIAQPMPPPTTDDRGAAGHMPCHASPVADTDAAGGQPHCPDCADETPATQCGCCDDAAPTCLATMALTAGSCARHRNGFAQRPSDTLPRSPYGRLYRPPIQPA